MSKPMEGVLAGNPFIIAPHSCQSDNGGEGYIKHAPDGDYPAAKAPPGLVGADRYCGDSLYMGFGFLGVSIFILIECFGTAFMRNCNVAISLLLAYGFSALWQGDDVEYFDPFGSAGAGANVMSTYEQRLVTGQFMHLTSENSPVSFVWNEIAGTDGFRFGFKVEYLLPLLMCFIVTTVESIGDITASAIASKQPIDTKTHMTRVQGGLLADGINSFLACLMLTPPNTTFSQNNGVISMTNCASRAVGLACAGWLILFGIFLPIGSFLADIPICVLGGIVTILFCSITVGGIKILSLAPKTRRTHVILAISLGFAVGVAGRPFVVQTPASFYGSVLDMNTGIWPLRMLCKSGTEVLYQAEYPFPGDKAGTEPLDPGVNNKAFASWIDFDCTTFRKNSTHLHGPTRRCVLVNPNGWVKTCEIDDTAKGARKAVLIMLGSPYTIGPLVAFLLNLFLPGEEEEDEEVVDEGLKALEPSVKNMHTDPKEIEVGTA